MDVDELKATTKWTLGTLGGLDTAVVHGGRRGAAQRRDAGPCVASVRRGHTVLPRDDNAGSRPIVASTTNGFMPAASRRAVPGFSGLLVERSNVFAALDAHAGGLTVPLATTRAISFVYSVGNRDDRYVPNFNVPFFSAGCGTPMTAPGFKEHWRPTASSSSSCSWPISTRSSESIVRGKEVGPVWAYRTSLVGASNSYEFVSFDELGHAYPDGNAYPLTMADLMPGRSLQGSACLEQQGVDVGDGVRTRGTLSRPHEGRVWPRAATPGRKHYGG